MTISKDVKKGALCFCHGAIVGAAEVTGVYLLSIGWRAVMANMSNPLKKALITIGCSGASCMLGLGANELTIGNIGNAITDKIDDFLDELEEKKAAKKAIEENI